MMLPPTATSAPKASAFPFGDCAGTTERFRDHSEFIGPQGPCAALAPLTGFAPKMCIPDVHCGSVPLMPYSGITGSGWTRILPAGCTPGVSAQRAHLRHSQRTTRRPSVPPSGFGQRPGGVCPLGDGRGAVIQPCASSPQRANWSLQANIQSCSERAGSYRPAYLVPLVHRLFHAPGRHAVSRGV